MFSNIISTIQQQKTKYITEFNEVSKYQREILSASEHTLLLRPFIINKGKRLRSIIYFDNWNPSANISPDIKYETIALIEMIHFASLAHDDIVDNNYIRRNDNSFFGKYGKKNSILYGDYILISSINRFLELHKDNSIVKNMFLKELENTAYGALLEQKLDLDSSFSEYFNVIKLKTASFFGLCAFLGKFLSTNDYETAIKAYNLGIQFGIIFQAQNDIDGYQHEDCLDSEDFMQENITLPIVLLKESGNRNIRKIFDPDVKNYLYIKDFTNSPNFKELARKHFEEQIQSLDFLLS